MDGERAAVSRSAAICREGAARRLQLAGCAIITDFPFTELAPAEGAARNTGSSVTPFEKCSSRDSSASAIASPARAPSASSKLETTSASERALGVSGAGSEMRGNPAYTFVCLDRRVVGHHFRPTGPNGVFRVCWWISHVHASSAARAPPPVSHAAAPARAHMNPRRSVRMLESVADDGVDGIDA